MLIPYQTLSKNIAYYRKWRKLFKAQLASIVGIRLKHLIKIEAGLRIPRINELVQLAAGLGLSIDELVVDSK